MSNIWGKNIKISIFGESHGECVGIVIDNLPSGISLDIDYIKSQMNRRKSINTILSTQRQEKDEFKIISGYFNEKTTGAPLTMIILNHDVKTKDYDSLKNILRPSHADYTAYLKYGGYNDYRGGGHFSARLTAGIVFAGAIAKSILLKKGIEIAGVIESVGKLKDDKIDVMSLNLEGLNKWVQTDFPVNNTEFGERAKKLISDMRNEGNSVGGVIRCFALGVPATLGEPFFDSFESHISHLLFSIPAVKGVSFGDGFDIATMYGKEANDEYYIDEDTNIKTTTNHSGGILGGITNGMPIDFRVAFKPTPSISVEQRSVDVYKMEGVKLSIAGRHDPCVLTRAVVIVESAIALTLLDFMRGDI